MGDALVAAPVWRPIRIGMLVNGKQVGGLKAFSVTNSSNRTCDKWSATIGLQGTPAGYGAEFWSIQPGIEVTLLASVTDGGELQPIAGGMADTVHIDLATQDMTVDGRDFTAALIDKVSNEKFTNQTSSMVAQIMLAQAGLIPDVTATKTPVGRFMDSQSDFLSDDASAYRILSHLADQEGFDFYAKGKTVYFGPPKKDNNPLIVTYQYSTPNDPVVRANAPKIELTQHKTLARGATVQVRSWNYQHGKPTIATWVAKPTQGPNIGKGGPTVLTYSRAQNEGGTGTPGPFYIERQSGLTQQQADQLAQKKLGDYTSHERSIEVSDLPAVLDIDARRTLRLTGTGTAFDMDYHISEISRSFSFDGGSTMNISAKSAGAQSEDSL